MKIGFDISDLQVGRMDGTTRYTFELAKRLPMLGPAVDWMYFSSGPLAMSPLTSTNRNVRLYISLWPKYWTQSRLWFDLYQQRPSVLFMPIQQLPYIRPGKMKTVCVVHDLAFHVYPEQFTYKDWALQHIFTSYVAREADHIIAVSQATADDMVKFYGRSENVSVVHHGVDHDLFRPPVSEIEKDAAWQKLVQWQPRLKKPYLLYVGQIQPRKNLIRLIEAWEHLQNIGKPTMQLVLAGAHGWLNKSIYDRAKASPTAPQIVMLGRVPEALLIALYWHGEVFVLPSLYEGFGLPLLEAMAAGCPIVTSSVSAMPEIVKDAAVLVDPTNGRDIARGIEQARGQVSRLRAAGLSRADDFSWDATAKKTLSLLLQA